MFSGVSPSSSRNKHSVVGMLEKPHPIALRARESALHVAEQFALEQGFDNGGAVEIHETSGTHRAQPVKGARHEFLTGAGRARNQGRFGNAERFAVFVRTGPASADSVRPCLRSDAC